MKKKFLVLSLISCGVLLLLFCASLASGEAVAQSSTPTPTTTPAFMSQDKSGGIAASNDSCLACHAQPDQYMQLPSGEQLYITVDPEIYESSVHGEIGIACVQCHTDITGYPHPPAPANNARDFTIAMNQSCQNCHAWAHDRIEGSVHDLAMQAGNKEAPVCTDCHGSHNTTPPDELRSNIPRICERCHSEIYNIYKTSTHGGALVGEGNPDVPTCIDCHGVHSVKGPSSGPFRLYSPLICEKCHANEELMTKYGISTDVFDTYISDFHGTTVIFEETAPGQETNKPVCIDCHGVHDIQSKYDPESTVMQENLLTTCQKCHPDATANFPSAWMGHYIPNRVKNPLTYFVNLFYSIFIPLVLGGMAIFVVTDAARRLINRRKGDRHVG